MKLQQLAVLLDQSTRNHSFQRIAGQNSTASFASYPALTFFLKKVRCVLALYFLGDGQLIRTFRIHGSI